MIVPVRQPVIGGADAVDVHILDVDDLVSESERRPVGGNTKKKRLRPLHAT